MAWDDVAGKAAGNNGDKYVVLQVVLTENYLALVQAQLVLLICNQKLINKRPKDTGFTISTTSSGSKGFLGGDKIQATMVFERID